MSPGYIKILAPPTVACPKCDYMNDGEKGLLDLVADADGSHLECRQCSYDSRSGRPSTEEDRRRRR